jgi:hypothetical protein
LRRESACESGCNVSTSSLAACTTSVEDIDGEDVDGEDVADSEGGCDESVVASGGENEKSSREGKGAKSDRNCVYRSSALSLIRTSALFKKLEVPGWRKILVTNITAAN